MLGIFDLIDSLNNDNAKDVAEQVKSIIDENYPNIRKPNAEDLVDAPKFDAKTVKELGIMVIGNLIKAQDEAEKLDIISSLYALMLQLDTSSTNA